MLDINLMLLVRMVLLIASLGILGGCHYIDRKSTIASTYVFIEPEYTNVDLIPQIDSLEFALDEDSYNQIRAVNYFEQFGYGFVSFYDRRSNSINIYDFETKQLKKRIELKKLVSDSHLKYTSVFVQNFDSIFVSNMGTLYLFDSAGVMKRQIECVDSKQDIVNMDNSNPLIVKGSIIYAGLKSRVDELSSESLRKWRGLYMFNLDSKEQELLYQLPELYIRHIFGDNFLDVSYCINDKGNFIFSFPADTNIYETNLVDYHIAYYGKSKFQESPITPVPKIELEKDNGFKQYIMRDSYGPIYYDSYKKRYLRIARQKINEELYETNKWVQQRSLIIFDENYRIIGESKLPTDLSYSSIFFTSDGGIYSRVNFKDEYALHFVRLVYEERKDSLPANKNI